MSRRIRSIKPEIIEDEKTGPLSDTAFRLFTSMITMADDLGNVRADARWLQAQIWWAHPSPPNVLPALIELTKSKLIEVYGVRGGTYAHLMGWSKHQRVDNAGKGKVPVPNDADALIIDYQESESDDSSPRVAASRREIPLDRIGEEGRGVSGKPDLAADLAGAAIAEINRLAGTSFEPESKTAIDFARALVKLKHTPQDALAVIQSKREWLTSPDMRQHFCPSTLLRPKNFQKYLDDLRGRERKAPARSPEPETMFVNGQEYVIG